MKINAAIVKASASYVTAYLEEHLDKNFLYHNLSHTQDVVNAAERLCDSMELDKHQKRLVLTAAWFHDLGYTQQMDHHETAGASLADQFLAKQGVDTADIAIVRSCILATHYPQQPQTLLQQILCDADMMHLGNKNFMENSHLLRKEWELTRNKFYTDMEWYELNTCFVDAHRFHTEWCRVNLAKRKAKNGKQLQDKLSIGEQLPANLQQGVIPVVTAKSYKGRLERGVETLFRSASSNHMRLSGMADNKAHILLSINSIIISIILSVLAKKLSEATYLVFPTILLLAVSVTTIVFAVLTTKPKIAKGVFTPDQVTDRKVNLLFFGNFHSMDLEVYEWGIREMMYDKDYLYKSMTKDIYFLGKVLAAKYRYLNIGYRIFMWGLLASVAAFAISFLFGMPTQPTL